MQTIGNYPSFFFQVKRVIAIKMILKDPRVVSVERVRASINSTVYIAGAKRRTENGLLDANISQDIPRQSRLRMMTMLRHPMGAYIKLNSTIWVNFY